MRVCFSVGQMSSRLISAMAKSADNVEFSTYSSISEMIKESTMRQIFFDRIVFSEKILINTKDNLEALNNYITEYSDNTKIVFICQGGNSDNINLFSELFNSPLYTPVLVEKVTTKVLLEFVKGDIAELKAKYYSLDIKQATVVTSKYVGNEDKNIKPVEPSVEKKGFLKSLFGGKKNSAPKIENQNPSKEPSITEGKGIEIDSKISNEIPSRNIPSDIGIGGFIGAGVGTLENGIEGNIPSYSDVLGSVGGADFNSEFSYNELEEDNLGLGDLGEQHIDTGFLDEDAENEIEEALKNIDATDENKGNFSNTYNEVINNQVFEEKNNIIEDTLLHRESTKKRSKYRIVLGERGTGVTSYIVDSSVKSVNNGKRVLIVDLDYKKNGILSYIDTNRFFNGNFYKGVDNIKVYSEDGVGIISNGYGVGLNSNSISALLSSSLFDKYDIVFIDCPLDCIDCLSEELISSSIAMVKVHGNKGSLLSTIDSLTNRKSISPNIEDILYKNSKFDIINKIDDYNEDLQFIKNICFYGRGDWFSKIN